MENIKRQHVCNVQTELVGFHNVSVILKEPNVNSESRSKLF